MQASPPVFAYWYLGLGLFSFSFSPILVRLAGDAPALSLALWRNAFAVAMLAPYAWVAARPAWKTLSGGEVTQIGLAGVLLGVHFYLFFEAIKLTTVASATVFVSITPIFLAILGFFFLKERLPLPVVVAIVIAVGGGILIAYGDAAAESTAPNTVLGNGLALTACLFVSIYLLIGRVARRRLNWIAYVFPLYVASALTLLLLCVATQTPVFALGWGAYGLCVLMAIGPHITGHGSFNYAVKYFPAAMLGLLSLTEPIGSTALAYWLFGEFPGPVSLIGMSITLLAVVLALRRN